MARCHCWEGEEDHVTEYARNERDAREYAGEDVRPWGICMLWNEHAGEHEWVDPRSITVRFRGESDG